MNLTRRMVILQNTGLATGAVLDAGQRADPAPKSHQTPDPAPKSRAVTFFQAALPVWPEGRETELNLFVEFRADFDRPAATPVSLRLTGASYHRAFVNGQFAGYGPARAWHGAFRVDQWDITSKLKSGRNHVILEVAGYNLNCSSLPDQPSFLQAELVADQRVIAATGAAGFAAKVRQDRVRKVQRFSFQRPFSEIWRLPGQPAEPARCNTVSARTLAPRRVPYPAFEVRRPIAHIAQGEARLEAPPERPWKDRSLTDIDYLVKGFREQELYAIPSIELQAVRTVSRRPAAAQLPFQLPANSYRTLDFGVNLCGFIGARIRARTATRLFLIFDEILTNGEVDLGRHKDCVKTVLYELQPGTYEVESFEPYGLRYLKFLVLEGACEVQDCYLRELANPEAGRGQFSTSDPRLNRIFEAARETFRQCAVDLLMDNPVRRDGKLQATTNRTEACQYFAFYFGVATPELHPKLWRTLVADFGPRRARTKAFPEVHPAAAFFGHQLRIELLAREKCVQQAVDDAIEYWLPMAESTGTLWEHSTPAAALTQGFQANAAALFLSHICGLHTVDPVGKIVRLRFSDLKLDWCKGSAPTPDGSVELQWEQTGKAITYRLRLPSGYRVDVENLSGKTLTQR